MNVRPSFSFEATDRHLAYFHVDTKAGNVLGWVIARKGEYLMFIRNRTFIDNLLGPESRDIRSVYVKRATASDDAGAVALLRALCNALSQGLVPLSALWGLPRYTFHEFKIGTWQEVLETLRLDNGFTVLQSEASGGEAQDRDGLADRRHGQANP